MDPPTNQNTAETPSPEPAEPPRLSRAARREKAAADALRALIRDLHLDRFGAVLPAGGDVPLTIRLTARPQQAWELAFDPPLSDQIGRQVEEAQAGRAVFRSGRVYCFRCESTDCEHARPPSALTVFKGYSATGLAEWQDLHQAFIEARDERVDRLFDERAQVLTLVQLGHDLRLRQLSSFGRSSKTYAILGQVVAGYFLLPRKLA
jgi:hypothetical protein